MPTTTLTGLPDWLQIVLIVGAVAVALVGVGGLIRKVWEIMSRFVTRVNALDGLPEFMIVTAKTLEAQDVQMKTNADTLGKQGVLMKDIHHEVHYNNGSSVKDAIARMEKNQTEMRKGIEGLYPQGQPVEPPTKPTPRKRTPKATP